MDSPAASGAASVHIEVAAGSTDGEASSGMPSSDCTVTYDSSAMDTAAGSSRADTVASVSEPLAPAAYDPIVALAAAVSLLGGPGAGPASTDSLYDVFGCVKKDCASRH